mgnify:CR=1 FL=1
MARVSTYNDPKKCVRCHRILRRLALLTVDGKTAWICRRCSKIKSEPAAFMDGAVGAEDRYARLSRVSSVLKFKAVKHSCFEDEKEKARAYWLVAAHLEVEAQECLAPAQRRWIEAIWLYYAAAHPLLAQEIEAKLSPEALAEVRKMLAEKAQNR